MAICLFAIVLFGTGSCIKGHNLADLPPYFLDDFEAQIESI